MQSVHIIVVDGGLFHSGGKFFPNSNVPFSMCNVPFACVENYRAIAPLHCHYTVIDKC